MAAPGTPQGPGIQVPGHASFNTRLLSRLSLAPADLMHFLEEGENILQELRKIGIQTFGTSKTQLDNRYSESKIIKFFLRP